MTSARGTSIQSRGSPAAPSGTGMRKPRRRKLRRGASAETRRHQGLHQGMEHGPGHLVQPPLTGGGSEGGVAVIHLAHVDLDQVFQVRGAGRQTQLIQGKGQKDQGFHAVARLEGQAAPELQGPGHLPGQQVGQLLEGLDPGMGAQGQKRPEHGVQPAPVGALIDNLGRLHRAKPEDGPHRVHYPPGMKVGGPDVRVEKRHHRPGMGDVFGHHQMIQKGPHGRPLARGGVLLVRREPLGRGKDLDLGKEICQAPQTFGTPAPIGDPDLIDEARKKWPQRHQEIPQIAGLPGAPHREDQVHRHPLRFFQAGYRLRVKAAGGDQPQGGEPGPAPPSLGPDHLRRAAQAVPHRAWRAWAAMSGSASQDWRACQWLTVFRYSR